MDAQKLYSNMSSLKKTVKQMYLDANLLKQDAESSKNTLDQICNLCDTSVGISESLNQVCELSSILQRAAPENQPFESIHNSASILRQSSNTVHESLNAARRHIIPLSSALGDKQLTRPGLTTKNDQKSEVGLLHVLGSICYVLSLLNSCLNAQHRELGKLDQRSRSAIDASTPKLKALYIHTTRIEEQFLLILEQQFNSIHDVLKKALEPIIHIDNILNTAAQVVDKVTSDINPMVERYDQLFEELRPLDEGVQRVFVKSEPKAVSIMERSGFTKSQISDLEQRLSSSATQFGGSVSPDLEAQLKQLHHSLPGDHIIESMSMEVRGLETKLKKTVGDFLPQCESNRALLESLSSTTSV